MLNSEQFKFSDEGQMGLEGSYRGKGTSVAFLFSLKEFLSGLMVIAQIPVQSNEDLNTGCKVLFPFIISAI